MNTRDESLRNQNIVLLEAIRMPRKDLYYKAVMGKCKRCSIWVLINYIAKDYNYHILYTY